MFNIKRTLQPLWVVLLFVILTACSHSPFSLVYKIEQEQGNFIKPELLQNIKVGMSTEQVHYLLGSPAIVDTFHPEIWHYVYTSSKVGKKQRVRRVSLSFKDNALIKIEEYG
ncbi:MAG: outer membrane protein assembly factor BamE [Gammaproteobacteria bacterium]|nr:outer membrane protein assembly factor BamE [Gammaproteobacteria bacterium]